MSQATGGKTQVCLGFETNYNELPGTPDCVVLPVLSYNVTPKQELKTSGVMNGSRNPVRPYSGFVDGGGSASVPIDAVCFGYWLKTLLGAPTTTQQAAKNIGAGPAVNKGGGKVGIPLVAHGIPVGVTVTIAGTTSYNGDYVVDATTTVNEIVIAKAYTAETFAAGTVRAKLYTHLFKVPDEQPSFFTEKQFLNMGKYELVTGNKTGKLDFSVGGDGELTASIDITSSGLFPVAAVTALEEPTKPVLATFLFDGAYLYKDGVAFAKATEFSQSVSGELDTGIYPIGLEGMRGSLPEGVYTIGGSMKVLGTQEGFDLIEAGNAHTDISLKMEFKRPIESLAIEYQEVQVSRTSLPIDTPKGLFANISWMAFWAAGASGSAVTATLVNQVASY